MGAPEALIETWCLYSVGSLVIFARIGSRWRMIGIAGFKPDDYLIFFSWATYTVMTVAADIVGGLGDLHALPLEVRKNMTEEESMPYIYGTQWFCAGVATYILFIWTLKLNMLFLYQRIVKGLWVEKFIKPAMGIIVATFVANMLILFCACRPYNRMWTVYPDQGDICQPQSTLNMVPPLIMNVLTDVMIMAIPAPVIIGVKTDLWKRVGLLILFGAGVFVMIAAILRVTMVLVMKNGATAAIWSCREDFVAIVIGQAILIRPMFSKSFWVGGKYTGTGGYSSGPSKNSRNLGASYEMNGRRSQKSKTKDPFSVTAALATVLGDNSPPQGSPNGSTEKMIDPSIQQSGPMPTIGEDPTKVRHSKSLSDLESGLSSRRGGRMVIHVSKNVSVENTEPGKNTWQMHGPRGSLQATNDARAWKESA